jgi:hypothetical protein
MRADHEIGFVVCELADHVKLGRVILGTDGWFGHGYLPFWAEVILLAPI